MINPQDNLKAVQEKVNEIKQKIIPAQLKQMMELNPGCTAFMLEGYAKEETILNLIAAILVRLDQL